MNRRTFLTGLVLSAGLSSCGIDELVNGKKASSLNLNKVLLIGIDGLRPDALKKADAPNLDRLINGGAYSYAAQAGPYTLSGSCWSNILTGVWPSKHGVVDNTFTGAKYKNYPDFFTRLKKIRPELNTVSIVSWKPLCNKLIAGADKCSYHPYTKRIDEGDYLVARQAAKTLASGNPDILFAYFSRVDVAGHKYGFSSDVPEYLNEIKRVDGFIGHILMALRSRLTYPKENWLLLSLTDHGGKGNSHGGQTPEEKTIFYIANGGSAIPGELVPPPTQVDVVPTIFKHLEIPINYAWGLDGHVAGIK